MIGFPVFAEQPHNAGRLVRKGFGLRLDLRGFSVEELVSAIEEVITNPLVQNAYTESFCHYKSAESPTS